jgi:hypothetical protein
MHQKQPPAKMAVCVVDGAAIAEDVMTMLTAPRKNKRNLRMGLFSQNRKRTPMIFGDR